MNVGSLFSGIGGFDLGCERAGMSVVWQVENNAFCNRVLAKHWPNISRYGDIKTIDWKTVEPVDLVCGGFPCQPFSCAGKRRGTADDRYLWPEVVRCLDALRPAWFLGENVPGIINLALDQVCTDLESLGYTVWPVCIPACAVDAPHQRQRVWIVAHTTSLRCNGHTAITRSIDESETERWQQQSSGSRKDVADAYDGRLPKPRSQSSEERTSRTGIRARTPSTSRWAAEPNVGRVAYGISGRVDRLKGLGNAVVPQVVEVLGRMIMEVGV